eukprot:gene6213-6689_t
MNEYGNGWGARAVRRGGDGGGAAAAAACVGVDALLSPVELIPGG